ncbi:MAG: hypothetical protein JO154_20930 [Chitinophaga sp.]|uniref:hypothetical protein n=1 Tax=Chitinophaga sp. TaxID=1869181 RepID=UPI0025BEF97B|nr:hypothetical protein [Chitinophaga sp.]MBV8255079.1 hypothetical protein [Chitinophaga sp.]
MKNYIVGMLVVTGFLACNQVKKELKEKIVSPETNLIQTKQIHETTVGMSYLPAGWLRKQTQDAERDFNHQLTFKINIKSVNGAQLQEVSQRQAASYGLDTVFQLISGRDTLAPLVAEREANGNIGGVVYLVTFIRPEQPANEMLLVYKDWLYTSTRLVFPLKKLFIHQADSLSQRL